MPGRRIILCLALFLTGCVTTTPQSTVITTGDGIYLTDICDRYHIDCKRDGLSGVIRLSLGSAKAKGLIGSRTVVVSNKKIVLDEPVRTVRDEVVVSLDFKVKVIDRLKMVSAPEMVYTVRPVKEIVIDAGHGGKDPGALGKSGTREKDIVLDIAKRLKRILEYDGIKVTMTRTSDEFIDLSKRTEIASRSGADLFISIHANANPSRKARGVEVFSSQPLEHTQMNDPQRVGNQKKMFNHVAAVRQNFELQEILKDMLYTHKWAESGVLAKKMAKTTSKFAKSKNRGAKQEDFYVLRNTLIPAVLIEVGFLTNPREERLLKQSAHRQKIAYGIAKGLKEYMARNTMTKNRP